MVWLLAIGVPIACRHAESLFVSHLDGRTTDELRFFPDAM
jgi:hypothetical protein